MVSIVFCIRVHRETTFLDTLDLHTLNRYPCTQTKEAGARKTCLPGRLSVWTAVETFKERAWVKAFSASPTVLELFLGNIVPFTKEKKTVHDS